MRPALVHHVNRWLLSRVPVRFYERAIFFPLYREQFKKIKNLKIFSSRESLWDNLFAEHIGEKSKILYLEFGVCRGESIKHNAGLNSNVESQFIGFDTFEGLPEDWVIGKSSGHFSTTGETPQTDDSRIQFVKGLFQETLEDKLAELRKNNYEKVIIHFDADLYSSTLYCLMELTRVFHEFYFIFDEFVQDEGRALYNYQQAYKCELEYFSKTMGGLAYCNQLTGHLKSIHRFSEN